MIAKCIVHFLFLLSLFPSIHSSNFLPTSAKISSTWNGANYEFPPILSQKISNSTEMPEICFGFTGSDYSGYILGISAGMNCSQYISSSDIVLWSANRNTTVTQNAALHFSSQGDLILREANGTTVWSTNTSGKSVVGMRITATGNLLLYNQNNNAVWSSFDSQPPDTWLPGRRLANGQRITAGGGEFYLSVSDCGLCAFIDSNPPQRYRKYFTLERSIFPKNVSKSIQFKTGSLNFNDGKAGSPISVDYISDSGNAFHFMRLDNDGHLRVYQGVQDKYVVDDIFTIDYNNCSYPTVCGSYGICLEDGQCSCLVESRGDQSYFKPIDYWQPKRGCQETTQLSCNSSDVHLVKIADVTYTGFVEDMVNTDIDTCKQACLNNCSCKAALFRSFEHDLLGVCSLPSQLYSFMDITSLNADYPATFLKVQSARPSLQDQNNANRYATVFGIVFGTTFFVVLVGVSIFVIRNIIRKKEVAKEYNLSGEGDDHLDDASEMPKRFSYEDLKSATWNFHKEIGRGGFGCVYEGIFGDETIAVKCLDLSQVRSQGRKQFLAEVKIIGKIHHVNLVKLVGFCAENSHNLLAYEYMCNGSLDKWIFHEDFALNWRIRKKVILDVAKGLSYLHEDCRKRIIHLDIKPQNILLDDDFNAKVSDFGLARFIEKDESQVLTMMRGTRGYLAPEWFLNRRITEKVDVYSFGVVVLEIVCGRRNLDYSLLEESEILLHVVKRKAEENALYDVLDKRYKDLQHQEEAIRMIKTAIWCLHDDCTKRPSMSTIVKVVEGVMDMENISDYSFLTLAPMVVPKEIIASVSTSLIPSILSGPR